MAFEKNGTKPKASGNKPRPPSGGSGVPILQPPRQKHKGALGDAMRKHHNTQRMEAVRQHKGK